MARPLISIVIPAYNAQGFLDRCLESIVRQSFSDFEVVVVDDGSQDSTAEVVREWMSRDDRIRLLERDHQGISHALNAGIAEAEGDWIARMDADDLMLPHRLETQFNFANRHPELSLVGGLVGHQVLDENLENSTGMQRFVEWVNNLISPSQIAREIFIDCPIPHPTFFFRRKVIIDEGGYSTGLVPEDYELVLRLHSRGHRFGKVDEVVLEWSDHPGRASRVEKAYAPDIFRTLKVEYLQELYLSDAKCFYLWGAGNVGKNFLRVLQKNGLRPEALVDIDPRKIGQTIHGCMVWDPEALYQNWQQGALALCAVGAPGAREDIRQSMVDAGKEETADFIFVA